MPGCEAGNHTFSLEFNVGAKQAECALLSLDVSAGTSSTLTVMLNGQTVPELSAQSAPSFGAVSRSISGRSGLLTSGANRLTVTITAGRDDAPCGIYVYGLVSPYVPHHRGRLNSASDNDYANAAYVDKANRLVLSFEPLQPGAIVVGEYAFTNPSGLAASVVSRPVILDSTQPDHPHVVGCTHGRPADLASTGQKYFQRNNSELIVCWEPPGFADPESGVWRLEWQISRWSMDQQEWDVLSKTHVLDENRTQAVLAAGEFVLSTEEMERATGLELAFDERYRLGFRAINRAGLRSCPASVTACESRGNWSKAEGYNDFFLDREAPEFVAYARVWLCDPWAASAATDSDAPFVTVGPDGFPVNRRPALSKCPDLSFNGGAVTGQARGGTQADTSRLRLQWSNFTDGTLGSSVDRYEVTVLHVHRPGKRLVGEPCLCTALTPIPFCDCDLMGPSRDGNATRCDVLSTPRILEWARPQVAAVHPIGSLASNLEVGHRICIPSKPLNLGTTRVGEACLSDRECAPLPGPMVAEHDDLGFNSHPQPRNTDVLCVNSSRMAWAHGPFEVDFCCAPDASTGGCDANMGCAAFMQTSGVCMPAALVDLEEQVSVPDTSSSAREAACTDRHAAPIKIIVQPDPSAPAAVRPWLSHESWNIDGVVRAPASECEPGCGGNGSVTCCIYSVGKTYEHFACLSPGWHTLTLEDRSGFGWLGTNISLQFPDGTPLHSNVTDLTVDNPFAVSSMQGSCLASCGSWTCWDHLVHFENVSYFSAPRGAPLTCTELVGQGCNCHGCCIETPVQAEQWAHSMHDSLIDGQGWRLGLMHTKQIPFEVYPKVSLRA